MYFLEIDADRILRVVEESIPDAERRLGQLLRGDPVEVFRVPGWGPLLPGFAPMPASGDVIGYAQANDPGSLRRVPFSVYVRVGDVEAPVTGCRS